MASLVSLRSARSLGTSYAGSLQLCSQPQNCQKLALRPLSPTRPYIRKAVVGSTTSHPVTQNSSAPYAAVTGAGAITTDDAASSKGTHSFSSLLNPPDSTRPPSLHLPVRLAKQSMPGYLLELGKAYGSFYKRGLKAILVNRRLVSQLKKNDDSSTISSRANLLLRERTRHDSIRLPLFAVVVLMTGEFSPLVVLLFPKLTPYTCRVPTHVAQLRRKAQDRRLRSYAVESSLATSAKVDAHLARVLGIGFALWDRLGLSVPLASRRVNRALRDIVQDDFRIRSSGGVELLHPDEVALAAEQRGQDVRDRGVDELRSWLSEWVEISIQAGKGNEDAAVATVRERLATDRSL